MSDQAPARKVFVSYSHSPPENYEFVHALVGRLHRCNFDGVTFDVWLDDERLAGGSDVQDSLTTAIRQSDAGLFVVNSRWWERDRSWIRHEVAMAGENPDRRLVVLLRDQEKQGDLDHTFVTLKKLKWFPDDSSPDARFWEVFCGLTGREPGPRTEWERKGKALDGGQSPASRAMPQPHKPTEEKAAAGEIRIPSASAPRCAFVTDAWTYLVTEQDDWFAVGPGGKLHPPIHPPGDCALAAVTGTDELLLGSYDGSLARFNGTHWKILGQELPALCFAAGPDGDLLGTSTGHVLEIGSREIRTLMRMTEPVAALAVDDFGLLAIGARRTFGRMELPAPAGGSLSWLDPGDLGRPLGFFQTVAASQTGVFSATRLGILESRTGRIAVCPHSFDEGIDTVAFLGPQTWPYAVLTDAGSLTLVDAAVSSRRPVRLPRNVTVRGCASAIQHGSLLAWTSDGALYSVSPMGSAEELVKGGVVLAYTASSGEIQAVSWSAGAWSAGGGISIRAVGLS